MRSRQLRRRIVLRSPLLQTRLGLRQIETADSISDSWPLFSFTLPEEATVAASTILISSSDSP